MIQYITLLLLLLILIFITFKTKLSETFISNKKLPIYVSLTSIFKNQDTLYLTLKSIIAQTLKPNKIYIYLSTDKSFFDNGFKNKKITNLNLKRLIDNNQIIEIIWGKDIGPHGKLIPVLKRKWEEDCIIITVDDDTVYDSNLIKNLVNDYKKHKCVINYRGFTPNMNKLEDFDHDNRSKINSRSLYNFPLGKGGVLYTPDFFKKTGDLVFNYNIYKNTCDKQDDIWFYIIRMLNGVDCYLDKNKKWLKKDISNEGLWKHYNKKDNTNTKAYHRTLNAIKNM